MDVRKVNPAALIRIQVWSGLLAVSLLVGSEGLLVQQQTMQQVPIVASWHGDYPVAMLDRLPAGQRQSRVGYLGDPARFGQIWRALRPGEEPPFVDFDRQFVVFYRNVDFYNSTQIVAAAVDAQGVIAVRARQTMSALPIDDRVAMSLAVIPRTGITEVRFAEGVLPIKPPVARDPLDATYTLAGRAFHLEQGYAETLIDPASASRERISVVGEPAIGDLDGDGVEDSAMILAQHGGGSGTFFYVVAARQRYGAYLGSNGVLIGDRISLQEVSIRHGLLIVRYLRRRAGEPMAATPTISTIMVLQFEGGILGVRAVLGLGEQLLAGWIQIGHEVRSFVPCGQDVAHWISGESAALGAVMAGYRRVAGKAAPYTALFMLGAGRVMAPPVEGFGGDYVRAVQVNHLFELRLEDSCHP